VLGTRPGGEIKWDSCDLAKCIITEEAFAHADVVELNLAGELVTVNVPKVAAYGVEAEKELLFGKLPVVSAEANMNATADRESLLPEQLEEMSTNARNRELRKADMLARIVDIRNANASGIAFENRRRIVEMFSELGKPGDTGRTEVQVAIMTMQIRNLWSHLTQHKRDLSNRVSLRKLIHQRAKMLKYLKRSNRGRYEALLPRIGVEREAVEGELIV
jgi:small subunit ribosomal protein S15